MNTTFWIQLLGVIFGVMMFYFTFVRFKKKELNMTEFGAWVVCWIVLILVAIIPNILDPFVGPLNFYRRLDFFVVFGFFILLGISFYNYGNVKKMERRMGILVRKQALRDAERKR